MSAGRAWPTVGLGDCTEVVSGATPSTSEPKFWGGTIYWATPKDLSALSSAYISTTARRITQSGLASCAATILPPGSVLLSSRAPIGLVAISTVPMATNQGFKSLIPNTDRLLPEYLYFWLRSHRQHLQDLGNGATFKEVSRAVVERIQIPLPPLAEQRRVSAVLFKTDALRTKHRLFHSKLEILNQTIFLDMFGDLALNPKQWPHESLKDLGKITTGRTPPSTESGMFDGPIPFITPGDLETDEPPRRSLTREGLANSVSVRPGSTLVCCIGATIGKMSKTNMRSAFNQQINAIEWNSRIDDIYGFFALRFFRPTIVAWSASTTLPILKKSTFEEIEIPVPPIALQHTLAKRITVTDGIRLLDRDRHRLSQELIESLQTRYFRRGS